MNTYYKFAANVFLAKCEQEYQKNDIIKVITQKGKEDDCIVFNLIGQKNGFYYYSIVRADGFNIQEWAKRKAEKCKEWAISAQQKSDYYYRVSQKDRDFLSLMEPIKVGHHSEKKHRRIIEQAYNNTGRAISFEEKAQNHLDNTEYWEQRANVVNLSMPESIEFYDFKLSQAIEHHKDLLNNPNKREHAYSLTYAKKAVNEAQKNYDLALKLWK